jgi:molybdopterin-biosynthesis enzyme MoeA-like protein
MSKSQKQSPVFETPAPVITPQQLARIRAAARHYLLAGGGLVPGADDVTASLSDHIGNVRNLLDADVSDDFEAALEQHVPARERHEPHEAISSAAWLLADAEGQAGFAFGVAVAFEVTAQMFGTKGGTR